MRVNRIGLWAAGTGFDDGVVFIWNIYLGVVRCGCFRELVVIILLFMGGWRLSSECVF